MCRSRPLSYLFGLIFGLLASSSFAKPATSLTIEQKALHVYDRLAFGPKPGDVEQLASQGDAGIQRWIDTQLHPERIDDSAVEKKIAKLDVPKMSNSDLFKRFRKLKEYVKQMNLSDQEIKEQDSEEARQVLRLKIGQQNLPPEITREMRAQKIVRAVDSQRQLEEVLMDFWFNHFNVFEGKGEIKWFLPSYERDALRPHLFGKFVDLLKATAHHPAMLAYLDNRLSQVSNAKNGKGINENYAREIMELHTLGVDGGYTQKDVTELARILTGWSIGPRETDSGFKFKPKFHDPGAKTFLGRPFPALSGRASLAETGEQEGSRAIEILAAHPSTARHIATKLAQYFVADNPPKSLIDKLAHSYASSGGDLRKVYQTLFASEEFWSPAAFQSKVKKPYFYTVSAIRALDGTVDIDSAVHHAIHFMGEDLYGCAPPTGYKDTAETWVNPGAMVSRMNFAVKLASQDIDGVYVQLPSIPAEAKAQDAKAVIQKLQKRVLHKSLSENSKSVIFKELESENRVMEDGETRPLDLTKATALLIASPEFQKR